jgi:hypothetical protein
MSVTIDGVWIGDSIYWPLIHSRLISTSNYNAIANPHILKITREVSQFAFTNRFLITASNSGDSSASRAQVLPLHTHVQN